MAYKKFDDPAKTDDNSPRKVYNAFPVDPIRRAMQGAFNRVISGNRGTTGTVASEIATNMASSCGTGATGGCAIGAALAVMINGVVGTRSSAGSLWLPPGTQSAMTWVKYLLAGGFGSTGTCIAGNEAGTAAGSSAAKLPDCPDGLIALGYFQYLSGTSGWNRGANVCTGQTGSAGTGTFHDLVCMPYDG